MWQFLPVLKTNLFFIFKEVFKKLSVQKVEITVSAALCAAE